MLSLLISALVATALASALIASQFNTGTTVFFSIAGFVGTFFLVGFLVRKKMSKAQSALQESMEAGQRRIQRKVQQFQNKPGGNIKQMQRQIEMDQKVMVKRGIRAHQGTRTLPEVVLAHGTPDCYHAPAVSLPAQGVRQG